MLKHPLSGRFRCVKGLRATLWIGGWGMLVLTSAVGFAAAPSRAGRTSDNLVPVTVQLNWRQPVEFAAPPVDMARFCSAMDEALQRRNPYYRDLITGRVLRPLVVRSLPRGAFAAWMKARGMNDAQSKVPRLANDRRYVEGLG